METIDNPGGGRDHDGLGAATHFDAQPARFALHNPELTGEQVESDEDDLRDGLRGLSSLVADARSVNAVLADVADFAALAIPGVDGVGVTLLHVSDGMLEVRTWEVTAPFVQEIDMLQYKVLNEGPCIACMQTGRPVVSESLGTDPRWPRFGTRVAAMGVNSALSLALFIGDQVIGSINCYAHATDAFGQHAVRLGFKFAGPTAVSVYNTQLLIGAQERAQHLQSALTSRKVLDQAIGIIRGRAGATVEEALDELRRTSQSKNVKIAVIAQRVLDAAVRRAQARTRTN